MLKWKKVGDHSLEVPRQAHPGDAGVDLQSVYGMRIQPGTSQKFPTGWAVAIPSGFVGLVCPRSGLALKHHLTVTNAPGVIDSGYRGEVCVILSNLGRYSVEIKPGDRIAQLLVTAVFHEQLSPEVVEELDDTSRGAAGFGSTGE